MGRLSVEVLGCLWVLEGLEGLEGLGVWGFADYRRQQILLALGKNMRTVASNAW